MTFAIAFPAIDPVLIQIGPFAIRWYALAYIAGLVLGWRYALKLADASPADITREAVDDFLVWATVGVILGGRLGYVFFYKFDYYLANPVNILTVWQGGMSFHGGLVGVCAAAILFCRKRSIALFHFADILACVAPIGLFFGRIANFINGELFGRVADVPWAMVFPMGGPDPRHPSQLYEAALEGLVLFIVVQLVWRNAGLRARPGFTAGTFFIGYGAARIIAEFFRQPDAHLGFFYQGATMGQLLCLPMILIGLWLIDRSRTGAGG
ncbi:MAG: prolipoprotein diacylglyceryl transferase [Rhodospirillaceae bacterium]